MIDRIAWRVIAGAALFATAVVSRADLYGAQKAVVAGDYPRAFELYREIAELGRLEGQENLASMYVNGEGVKRDNVLGLAWARIAAENGSKDVQNIIDQLAPHVTPAVQERVDALHAQFGKSALNARLLPTLESAPKVPECRLVRPVNPDDFYPSGLKNDPLGAEVIVVFEVQPDGRAHTARVKESTTPIAFDEAARAMMMQMGFTPAKSNGVAVSCVMSIKILFRKPPASMWRKPQAIPENIAETKENAESGDPLAQIAYAVAVADHPELNKTGEPVLTWFVKAAQAGLPEAQFEVGSAVLDSSIVRNDPEKARAWLRLAARAGHPQAQVLLANHLLTASDDPAAGREALAMLERGEKLGYYAAMYSLAALLAASPDESVRDPKRALALIEPLMPIGRYDPVPHQVVAAANAALGDFDAAEKSQKMALARARKLGWDVTPLEARMKSYEAKRVWTGNLLEK